jgi:hypothetical protein
MRTPVRGFISGFLLVWLWMRNLVLWLKRSLG